MNGVKLDSSFPWYEAIWSKLNCMVSSIYDCIARNLSASREVYLGVANFFFFLDVSFFLIFFSL